MVEDNRITVNISKEKYDKLLYSFIDSLDEPCFFILERNELYVRKKI